MKIHDYTLKDIRRELSLTLNHFVGRAFNQDTHSEIEYLVRPSLINALNDLNIPADDVQISTHISPYDNTCTIRMASTNPQTDEMLEKITNCIRLDSY